MRADCDCIDEGNEMISIEMKSAFVHLLSRLKVQFRLWAHLILSYRKRVFERFGLRSRTLCKLQTHTHTSRVSYLFICCWYGFPWRICTVRIRLSRFYFSLCICSLAHRTHKANTRWPHRRNASLASCERKQSEKPFVSIRSTIVAVCVCVCVVVGVSVFVYARARDCVRERSRSSVSHSPTQ